MMRIKIVCCYLYYLESFPLKNYHTRVCRGREKQNYFTATATEVRATAGPPSASFICLILMADLVRLAT